MHLVQRIENYGNWCSTREKLNVVLAIDSVARVAHLSNMHIVFLAVGVTKPKKEHNSVLIVILEFINRVFYKLFQFQLKTMDQKWILLFKCCYAEKNLIQDMMQLSISIASFSQSALMVSMNLQEAISMEPQKREGKVQRKSSSLNQDIETTSEFVSRF